MEAVVAVVDVVVLAVLVAVARCMLAVLLRISMMRRSVSSWGLNCIGGGLPAGG